MVATAGADGEVHLFDRSAGRVTATLQGHSKKINGARLKLGPSRASGRFELLDDALAAGSYAERGTRDLLPRKCDMRP